MRFTQFAIDRTADSVFWMTPDGKFIYVNDAACRSLGYTREELLSMTVHDIDPDFPREAWPETWRRVREEGSFMIESHHRTRDGEVFPVEITVNHLLFEGQEYNCSIVRNRTAQRRAQEEIQRSQKLLEAIHRVQTQLIREGEDLKQFEKLLVVLLDVTDSEYGFIGEVLKTEKGVPYLKTHAITDISWNAVTKEFYEKNAPEGLEFFNLDTLFGAVIISGESLITNDPDNHPRSGGRPEGHPPLRAFMGLPFHRGDELLGMVGIANRPGGYHKELAQFLDPFLSTCASLIVAYHSGQSRARAEQALREGEARYRSLFDNYLNGFCLMEMVPDATGQPIDWTYLEVNQACGEIINLRADQIVGKRVTEVIPEIDQKPEWEIFRQVVSTGAAEKHELYNEAADKHIEATYYRPRPGQVACVYADISMSRKAEQRVRDLEVQLAHVSRLSMLGELAANLGHELNQPLTAINNYVESCLASLRSEKIEAAKLEEILEKVVELTMRAGAIIKELRSLVRRGEPRRVEVHLKELICGVTDLIDYEARVKGVEVRLQVDDQTPLLMADPIQLQQVLLNLLRNSLEALGDIERPRRFIEIRTRTLEEGNVEIAVKDSGIGLGQTEAKIFEPFFTTKKSGLGMGLSISKSIAEAHGGQLLAESDKDGGAVFRFRLPCEKLIAKE